MSYLSNFYMAQGLAVIREALRKNASDREDWSRISPNEAKTISVGLLEAEREIRRLSEAAFNRDD